MTTPDDHVRDACGVVGVYSRDLNVAKVAFDGLFSLQHRGQESAGIATADGSSIRISTSMGLVSQAFDEEVLIHLPGYIGIGHTRYSTSGSSNLTNAQPVRARGRDMELALGHNGNLVNALELRDEILRWGCELRTTADSELLAHILTCGPGAALTDRIAYCMRRAQGAYSVVALTRDEMLAFRDPMGVRPLCIGRIDGDWVVASETCALDNIGADYVRDVRPGEAVSFNGRGMRTLYSKQAEIGAFCSFEYIYLARPDSVLEGQLVYNTRMRMGAQVAREHPVEADVVIGVPDSGTPAAVGYSQESGIPFGEGLVKNRYVNRTFILPDQRQRDLGVRRKLNPLGQVVWGKRLVVVEDSVVRASTIPHVVNILRKSGAKEVHVRIASPPIVWPCQLGIDMPTRRELIGSHMTVAQIREHCGADTLGYLSHEGLVKAMRVQRNDVCMACFTGESPVPVQLEMDKLALEV